MNITEHEVGGMRFFGARTGAADVVTMEGSVLGGYFMLGREDSMVPRLAAAVMDAGTRQRTKDGVRGALAARGASLHFSAGGDRTYFYARCLPENIDFMLKLIRECLGDAVFPASEVAAQKKRTLADLEESKKDTATQAGNAFARLVFDAGHANYPDTTDMKMQRVAGAARKDLVGFQSLLGHGGLVLAATGDIVPDTILKKAAGIFSGLPEGTSAMTEKRPNQKRAEPSEVRVPIKDKASIDICLGASVPLTYDSPEYLPLTAFASMLGGNSFSTGHLMRTIRVRDGLTYGIGAGLTGFAGRASGALRISATFSPETFERAVDATRKEIRAFLDTGMTPDALEAKKGEMIGQYYVGLSTTQGLSSILHMLGVEGKPLSYIDEYPSLINAISVADLKKIASIIPFDKLALAAAGTFIKK